MHYKHWFLASTCAAALLSSSVGITAMAAETLKTTVTVTKQFQLANQSMQTGQYGKAETQLMELLKKEPNNIKARGELALAQAELYKMGAAEKNANLVLEKDPNNALAYTALGAVLRNRTASLDLEYKHNKEQLLQESATNLEKAVALDPKSPEIQNQLGLTYVRQERFAEAQRAFNAALVSDPNFAEARVNQGLMKFYAGQLDEAEASYRQAIKLNSKNHSAHYRLGEVLLKKGNPHEALKSLNTALSLSPGNSAITGMMGEAYEQQGNTAAAVASYQKSILGNAGYMPSYTHLANIYDNRGDGELAMSILRSAVNVDPKFIQAYNQLGRLALSVDKNDQALGYFRQSLQVNPQDSVALQGLSQTLTIMAQKTALESAASGQESNLADAEIMLQKAIQANPNDIGLHLAMLRISQLDGKPEASNEELQKIIALPATTDKAKFIKGQAYYTLGQYTESDAIFRDLIGRSRSNPQQLMIVGDLLKADGNLPMAREAFLAAPPGNIKAQRALSRIDKQQAEAEKSLRFANAMNKKGVFGKGVFHKGEQQSAIDSYEDSLAKNPRQPEARLAVSKLYEKFDRYDEAARSYQMYLGLVPNLPTEERQNFENKILKMKQLAVGQ